MYKNLLSFVYKTARLKHTNIIDVAMNAVGTMLKQERKYKYITEIECKSIIDKSCKAAQKKTLVYTRCFN